MERARSDFSSDVTLASGAENTALTNRDLGNGTPHLEKSGFTDSSRRFSGSWNDLYTGCLAENKLERNDEGAGLFLVLAGHFLLLQLCFSSFVMNAMFFRGC